MEMLHDDKLKAVISLNRNDLLIPLDQILRECSNAVFVGLSLLENMNELPEAILGENEFIEHKPYGGEIPLQQRKTFFKTWLLGKGFEDLVRGVTAMLIDIGKVLDLQNQLKGQKTFGDFKKLLSIPNYEITKRHFPELLDKIRPYLSADLNYESEIASINRVRRCLVHRNGVVTPIDFIKDETNLSLCWVYFKPVYFKDGKEIEITKNLVLEGGGEIGALQERKRKVFNINEQVEFDFQLFNELIMTCRLFGQDLVDKLTLSKN